MRDFDYGKLREIKWDSEILGLVAQIHEYKGRMSRLLTLPLFLSRASMPAWKPAMKRRALDPPRLAWEDRQGANRGQTPGHQPSRRAAHAHAACAAARDPQAWRRTLYRLRLEPRKPMIVGRKRQDNSLIYRN